MSRIDVRAEIKVYADDETSEWGRSTKRIELETYWNDDQGEYAVLVIEGRRYTIVANDLRAALNAVTTRR